jgi:prophage regulatory protein
MMRMVEAKRNADRTFSDIFESAMGSLLAARLRPLLEEFFERFVEVKLEGIVASFSAADLKSQAWRLLRIDDVLEVIPVSKSTWFDGVKDGDFPKGVKIGSRTVAWRYGDIRDLAERLYREGLEEKAS